MRRAALLLALALSPACADTIVLKDGRSLEGEVLSETDDAVQLKIRSGKITLKRADILSVERTKKEAPLVQEDPVAARFATTGNAAVDEARKASFDLLRAFESASNTGNKDLETAREEYASAKRRFDSLEARRKALATKREGLYEKYLARLRACGG